MTYLRRPFCAVRNVQIATLPNEILLCSAKCANSDCTKCSVASGLLVVTNELLCQAGDVSRAHEL